MQTWCVDCRRLSPETESVFELGTEGWRAMRSVDGADFDWRCPTCWGAFREIMGDADRSSARFRAAPAIEQPASSDVSELRARSGELDVREGDTRPDARATMIARMLHEVYYVLATVSASARARELLAQAEEYRSMVSRWKIAPPGRQEQLDAFDRLCRLHGDASALVAAHRRVGR